MAKEIQINMPVIGTLVRFWRMVKLFGWSYRVTWQTLFPPFKGWEIGCDYCGCQAESIRRGECKRGKAFGWVGCGVTDCPHAQADVDISGRSEGVKK